MGAVTTKDFMKEIHGAPQCIKATINGKTLLTSQKKWLGPLVTTDVVRTEADESRVWDPGEDPIVDIDDVTRLSTCRGAVESAENEDIAHFERMNLDTHANMIVLGRNCHVVNYSGKTA